MSIKKEYLLTISVIMFLTLYHDCNGQSQQHIQEEQIFREIQESHLDANIPDKSQFDRLLKRDLEQYFSRKSRRVSVTWEFLRIGPTQSGAAYPKYYLWTKIYVGNQLSKEGATRIAAIEKTRFDVTDFVDIKEVKNNTKDIYMIFPVSVCEEISTIVQNN